MSLHNIDFNLTVRNLIASIERGDKKLEKIDVQFERYFQLKDKIGLQEIELDPDLRYRFQILKASYDFEDYLNNSTMTHRREVHTSRVVKKQRVDSASYVSENIIKLQPIVEYTQFEYRTAFLVPTLKKCIDEGSKGKVFDLDKNKLSARNPDSPLLNIRNALLVKKTTDVAYDEFYNGNVLSHKNLVKSYFLFVKKSEDRKLFKIVMEKIEGTTLKNIETVTDVNVIKKFINDTKDCCLYLFDQGYVWSDCHAENIIIETSSGDLKFIDYSEWKKEDNNFELTRQHFFESQLILDHILKKTKFLKIRTHLLYQKCIADFPIDGTREQLRGHIESYFNLVLHGLDEAIIHPNAYEELEDEESDEWNFSSSE